MTTLSVSEDGRSLLDSPGSPFFYLGDTAWELFHRLNREQVDEYLKLRAEQGYTVIQAVALAELDGLNTPNAYGHRPLVDNDPAKPAIVDGPANDYWDHVDYVVARANELGMRIGFLPTWGDKWNLKWGVGPVVFNEANARIFGEWIGRRYGKAGVIWIVGGDRPIENDEQKKVVAAMAEGLRVGDGGRNMISFHPPGGTGSSEWFHNDTWLDFNMRQNGHTLDYTAYSHTFEDYKRSPVKPVLDAEPVYEDHPVAFDQAKFGHTVAADARRALYWDLFNGACGHTYGHHSVWQMYGPGKDPINGPLMFWGEAIHQPGAAQMIFGRRLMESRPFLSRQPDPELIVEKEPKTAWPGAGRYRFTGIRDRDGSYAMIYAPVGRSFTVRTELLSGSTLRVWWYNPRTGGAVDAGTISREASHAFLSPDPGELLDWVLVLDDVQRGYPVPGRHPN